MDEHGWLPSSIFPSSKVLPTRKLRSSASLEPKGTSGNSQSKRVTRRVRLQNSNPNPHPALKIEVNPHRNIIPSDFFEAWLVRFVSWARQLQAQLQRFKWHKPSRVWNIAITPSWCTEATVASTVAVELQLRPLEKEKASKSCKPGTSMRFHEIL